MSGIRPAWALAGILLVVLVVYSNHFLNSLYPPPIVHVLPVCGPRSGAA
jgi:hypothetical protein